MNIKGFKPDGDEVIYRDGTTSFTRIEESSPTGIWEDDFIEIIPPKNSNSKIISFTQGSQRVASYIWDDSFEKPLEEYINEIVQTIYDIK